jgi:SAM-dependent methyltransferase
MNHAYNSRESSIAYEQFLESTDGQIFRDVVGKAFLAQLQNLKQFQSKPLCILDAGCGDGWLAGLLAQGESSGSSYPRTPLGSLKVHACDAGEPLIDLAKSKYPKVQFQVCDLNKPLPYQQNFFDIICASMVIHDVEDELATLQNLATVLKPGGKLLASIVNPYYGYPIGEWKRGIVGRLLNKKPNLRLARFYNQMMKQNRPNFEWRKNLGSHFTPLSTHITNASQAGLALTGLEDICSEADSPTYNLTYQLHRFPIILLLEFTKL